MRIIISTLLIAFLLTLSDTSWSGVNEGGVLIFHSPADVVFTSGEGYCGQSGIGNCSEADVSVEGGDFAVVFLLAAFPAANSPRLSGVAFGIDYNAADVEIVEWGVCGDFHLFTNDWPGPGSGSAVTWNEAQTDHLVEIHWFAARSVSGNPATLDVTEHPQGDGVLFADDSIPPELDVPVDLGRLGFGGEEGYLPCPDPTPIKLTTWGQVKATYRARD